MAESKIAEAEARVGMSREAWIRTHPELSTYELGENFGVSANTVSRWMWTLGLKKTAVVRRRR
jgi:DNA-binding transcriptional regulator YiaG